MIDQYLSWINFEFIFLSYLQYLSFPSLSNSGGQKFSFTIAETERVPDSFERIQQNHKSTGCAGFTTP